MTDIKKCSCCGSDVSADAKKCERCGMLLEKERNDGILMLGVGILIIAVYLIVNYLLLE